MPGQVGLTEGAAQPEMAELKGSVLSRGQAEPAAEPAAELHNHQQLWLEERARCKAHRHQRRAARLL